VSEQYGLSAEAIAKIRSVFSKYEKVQRAVLYGSRAKGNYRQGSDIDLTLEGPELTTADLLRIEGELDELLLPYKIDLSLFSQIENPDLRDHIERIGKVFFAKRS
jgi:predicted nucleotidyltransferase